MPFWKVLADGQQRVSLNTYARRNGVPCESRTHLRGFADHCLGCSANETFKCRLKNAKCRMPGGSFRLRRHCCLPLGVLEPELSSHLACASFVTPLSALLVCGVRWAFGCLGALREHGGQK